MLYKLIFFISVVSFLAFYSCVYPNTDCVKDIKHVETYEFEDPIQRTDYYYVYDFDYDDECYDKVAAFAKNIKLDTTKDHIIEFLRYDKYLPDSSKIKKAYLVDGKYNDYQILKYIYDSKIKSKILIYEKDGRSTKIVDLKN